MDCKKKHGMYEKGKRVTFHSRRAHDTLAEAQTGISPEFRATWLSRRGKKGHFRPFSAYFTV